MECVLRETPEREVKLKTGHSFRLPSFPGEPLPPRLFTSTYFDTVDFKLARLGVTLRRKTEQKRVTWQLKLPRPATRLDVEMNSGRSSPPAPLEDLLFALIRREPLTAIAKLRTRRSGIRVQHEDKSIADVDIDRVRILNARRVAGHLGEITVELRSGKGKELTAIVKALREAGAHDGDSRPTVFQALNLNISEPRLPETTPFSERLKIILQKQLRDILLHDPGTRLGKDPEELHQMRVGIRRFRALLRAARVILEPAWYASLQEELRWLSAMLGTVRDQDVLLEQLYAEARGLPSAERKIFERLLPTFEAHRSEARRQLLNVLRSDRYLDLLDRLEQAAQTPGLREAPESSLMHLAAQEFKQLIRAGKRGTADSSDHELHQLRIYTKRTRYAAELALEPMRKPAIRFVRQTKRNLDILGRHQDAVVTEERLRQLLQTTRGVKTAFAIGQIVERLRTRRHKTKVIFPREWAKLKKRGREIFAL
ncbi:MAG: CYTH and CHAD domain-containing protein [Nitrospira sp. SB0675_bin_23]|nr:CYTH and CHAD domain-containing protein [Nitrospira sp. SB0661_bin_20]MYH02761.1 CYTH and CHAD domain-containing protein [Nitrospira sp. SB0675_bin_23]MYJ23473.1 CYTH and CHAD domain-containing protein [Nitrospira sp. SB0673_bin_12]